MIPCWQCATVAVPLCVQTSMMRGIWACRKPGPKRSSEEMVGEPVGGITCETDIFRVLGLAYVPPDKRFFHNFE